jgi:putative aldouronate transport system permease protein
MMTRASAHRSVSHMLRRDFTRNWMIYVMALFGLSYYILFHYMPMYGAVIAFKTFQPARGILASPWVGLKHFRDFFSSYYFSRVLRNTVLISLYDIVLGFPLPIVLALMLNEVRKIAFKRAVQTIVYLPYFVSLVVVCGLIMDFSTERGLFNSIGSFFGASRGNLLMKSNLFKTIFVLSSVWQNIGWNTIIYLAALSGVDVQLYEASVIDGAGRWRQMLNVTLPGILPTIVIMFILRIGRIMDVGFEKVILLYNPAIYDTADVISSFVYRKGILQADYSYSAAVGLFNSAINFMLVIVTNRASRSLSGTSLW